MEKWQTYDTIKIARDDEFGNVIRTNQYEVHRQLAKIGKPVDKKEWEMSQPTVNAYYEPQQNNINFPAGILQPPFYDNGCPLDDAVNYGGIGAVIGHANLHMRSTTRAGSSMPKAICATGGRLPTRKPSTSVPRAS